VSADALSWREKTENWQALTTCAQATTAKLFPDGRRVGAWPGDKLLEVNLNHQERRVVGRLLTERKALLIETTEDTTQPDPARRAGSKELSVIESMLGKLSLRDLASTGGADLLRSR
jgi:hypothetical protein